MHALSDQLSASILSVKDHAEQPDLPSDWLAGLSNFILKILT